MSGKFLSTPSARRATSVPGITGNVDLFLSTPSARRATCGIKKYKRNDFYFYPRPPRGGRLMTLPNSMEMVEFLSTPSARRATLGLALQKSVLIDFYPRPPRGGRPFPPPSGMSAKRISIHALREEGDIMQLANLARAGQFLSTPSARRATTCCRPHLRPAGDFYPRPPRGGRPRPLTTTPCS